MVFVPNKWFLFRANGFCSEQLIFVPNKWFLFGTNTIRSENFVIPFSLLVIVNRQFQISFAPVIPPPFATIASHSVLRLLLFQCLIVEGDVDLFSMGPDTFRSFWCHFCLSSALSVGGYPFCFPCAIVTSHNLPVLFL